MSYLKSLLKAILFTTLILLTLTLLNTIFYYFDIIPASIYTTLKLITPLLAFLSGAYILGKNASKRGWLEGLKLGGIFVLIFLIINCLIGDSFSIKLLFYDFILLFTSSVGGMVGINRRKD